MKRKAGIATIFYRYSYLLLIAICMLAGKTSYAQSAVITVDCAAGKGILFRSEAYNNLSGVNTGAATRDVDFAFLNSVGLHSKILRVWISESIYNKSTGTYNFTNYDTYMQHASVLADELLMVIPGNTMVDGWDYTPDQCKPILKTIIKHYKTNFPKVKYVEALNEPDLYNTGSIMTSDVVYAYYKPFYQAVNEVNTELGLAEPLKVGGPTITSFKYAGDEWLRKFLDGYKNDTAPEKKLDFITFHTYSYKRYPREIETIRPKLEQWLSSRGLPTSIPSFITEVGLFPGADISGTEEEDALRQAAGMAAYTYWMNTSNKNIPFHWVVRHAAEVRKDQMVTRPKSYSDRLTPYGNMMRMMSIMKTQRISASSNVMDGDGMGVYGLASHDASGLSIMAWNYQHTAIKDYHTTVKVLDLPAIFNGKAIRKKVYKIDQVTSNNYYAVSNCNLQLVSDTTLANPGSSLDLALGIMNENTLQLVILEPVNTVMADNFGLHAVRDGNKALLTWSTLSESNSAHFEVLHAADGSNFSLLTTIPAAGMSANKKEYNYLHDKPDPGINYYQVKLVHNDSSRVESRIVSLFMNLVEGTTHIYYNFGATGAENGNPTSGVPAGWNASAVGIGNATSPTSFFTSVSPSNTYAGYSAEGNVTMSTRQASLAGRSVTYSGITTYIPVTPFSSLSYFQFTLTPAANEAVKIEQVKFGSRSIGSSGGPANIIIRTSLDNFTSNVFAKDVSANANWSMVTAVFDQPLTASMGVPVTIRIYGNDATGGSGNNWRIDDLDITATLGIQLPQLHTFTLREVPASQVFLQWQTSHEDNVTRFEILRSADGVTFTTVGQVTAVGNATTTSRYSFTDQNPLPGINHYQVKMVKGNNEFSATEVLNIFMSAWTHASIYYNFGATGNEHGSPTSGVPDGWMVTDVLAGNTSRTSDFFTSISATATYPGNSKEGNITTIAKGGSLTGRTVTYSGVTTQIPVTGIQSLSYFQVQLTSPADQLVNISSISFGNRSIGSSGGPANVVIRSSLDNFSANLFSQDVDANSNWQLVTATMANPLKGTAGQAITIRIYGNDAVGGSVNNWRIDDLDIAVVYTPAPGLPVTMAYFSAASRQQGVWVKWQTIAEYNNKSFTVERSADGRNYLPLVNVPGKGSANAVNNYEYLDMDPLPFTSYYRLKQTDLDGQFKYFGPVVVRHALYGDLKVSAGAGRVQVMVNAASASKAHIRIMDINGRALFNQPVSIQTGYNSFSFQLALPPGLYMLEVAGSSETSIRKFVR